MKEKRPKTTADGNPRLPPVPVSDAPLALRRPGRPAVLGESWVRANVILTQAQVIALDRLALSIRERNHAAVNRAALIRAAVDAMLSAGIDPADVTCEADLRDALVAKLQARR